MKKMMIIVVMICWISFVKCMESDTNGIMFELKDANTLVYLVMASSLYEEQLPEMATVTIAGKTSQMEMQEPDLCEPFCLGDVQKETVVYIPNKDCPYGGQKRVWPEEKKIVSAVEPHVWKSEMSGYQYYGRIRDKRPNDPFHYIDVEYRKEEAISAAKEHLDKYFYQNVLNYAHTLFSANDKKTIAFPQVATVSCFKQKWSQPIGLPANVGAEAAIASVLKFLKDASNKDKYETIRFVVSTKEDYLEYHKLINKFHNADELTMYKLEPNKK